jgi:hypothetical protein
MEKVVLEYLYATIRARKTLIGADGRSPRR